MKTEIEIDITPEQLANLFVNGWDNKEQADFLNLIGLAFKDANFDAEGQCCYIAQEINKHGRDFIYTVANFHKVRGVPPGSPKESVLIYSYDGDSLSDKFYLEKYGK